MGEYRISRNFALIHSEANVSDEALLDPHCVVHQSAVIGKGTRIGSNTVIGPFVSIGADCNIGCNVTLENCRVGDRCVIHSGVRVGQDGFGFYFDESHRVVKKPQTLQVVIGNDVEIGANSCVDRGSWRNTFIGDHTKIDNLVQIGHNVHIHGPAFICGQAGLAGSVTLGSYVRLAGRSGVVDHVTVGDHVDIAACSILTKNAPSESVWAGFPAQDIRSWKKELLAIRQLAKSYVTASQPAPSNPKVEFSGEPSDDSLY
ncbi:UDP-3-O-[3-hydroxymyristoyl] glucosamine N-acyltransferase [Galdieria sulphuraria]|uniref:UDP-3-O-[3-hydroxymyristoyl] glucosamine N-acyltransferase n=1 Tax=Galdieria sulphuraria TaxID=130081 RepID=M2WUJ2_GALSU|nr:UDP-3-O-[3-hydroxymyristoyl] glucosamine N-acyltransferase [Galdieria sulphuraria]EME27610.1 UDP-3-O-[3-hydroxymyristoyl] glucosamine N-acyltransferase [Galdieria sulphuraria]|eukprot:XP_005704130.1 UDP-3-O-[3-hydroxymyristoyl] glucosamine N-acyltransferase [Galdieria sulphuraria]